jgi:putative hydrolase of the HAD superfamily
MKRACKAESEPVRKAEMTGSLPGLALFDLDDTLIDRAGAFRIWAAAFVAERALGGEREVEWLEQADRDGLSPRAAEFFEQVRLRFALTEPVNDLMAAYRNNYPKCIQPPPEETLAGLNELKTRGWRIGIVSNGPPTQQAKIVAAGLAKIVDGWAISEVVGSEKPERAIFQAAADACGCTLDGGWVVGDDGRADIAGAAASGLRSIWISHGRHWDTDDYRPDAIMETVAEAIGHILAAS